MAGYRGMKRREWPASSLTNRAEIAGGGFEEIDAAREELVEILHAGPGEAARQEVAVTPRGPAPSRGTLRTIRASLGFMNLSSRGRSDAESESSRPGFKHAHRAAGPLFFDR